MLLFSGPAGYPFTALSDIGREKATYCILLGFEAQLYIEDYPSVWIVTQRHNCDVRKDSDQSNHTISKIS